MDNIVKRLNRIARYSLVFCVLVALSGCTRHKRGADAFEHYFGISPPKGVILIQAHWAGFYYAFGLDSEQMLLEFIAPEEVMGKLLNHDAAVEKAEASAEEKERVLGWKVSDHEAIQRGLQSAPQWFTPADVKNYEMVYLVGQSTEVRFQGKPSRYRMIIYASGNGHIYVDDIAQRVYIAQGGGGKMF